MKSKKKKIVIVGDWVTQPLVGMQRFALQIIKRLDLLAFHNDMEITVLIPQNTDFPLKLDNIGVVKKGKIEGKFQKHWWEQAVFPAYVRRNRAIGVDMTSSLPVFGCRIYAIHDCIHYLYPENFKNHKLFLYIQRMKLFLCTHKKNKVIVTVSDTSANDINKIYHVPYQQLRVVYNGWEHITEVTEMKDVFERFPDIEKDSYYMSIGSRYKHKNFKWITETAERNIKDQFVITGTNVFDDGSEEHTGRKANNVIYTGYLTDGELKSLIRHCKALILPSYYEGFGIPPLEALALEKKIIVSNASCLPEIYGDCAYYIDPEVPQENLDDLLNNKVKSPEAILEKYTWKEAAHRFYKILEEV